MSLERTLVMAQHNIRLLLGDPGPAVIFILTPLLVMAILRDTAEVVLVQEGFAGANGAEQVVPGFTVMFSFFWVAFVGRTFFVEHGWGTWERLQSTSATGVEVLAGKLLPAFVAIAFQMVLLFVLGALLFDLDSAGPILALALVAVPLIGAVLAFTVAVVGVVASLQQMEAVANLVMMLFAALGGALTPVFVLPTWAQEISPATPSYWALKASNEVILEGEGLSAVWGPAAVLVLFTAAFLLLAVAAFRMADTKAVA
ncbi:MAG: ABC transporter permease [Thermoleophilia bacterium]|nr:ABC transporter permease [Thermoleophilia bacterium]